MSDLKALLAIENELYEDYRKLQVQIEAIEPAYLAAVKAVDNWYLENANWELILEPDTKPALTSGSFQDCLNSLKTILVRCKMTYRSASLSSRLEDRFWHIYELSIIKDTGQRYELEKHQYRIAVVREERK